jgi:hypothetical protein
VALAAADQTAPDADGFLMSPQDRLATESFALLARTPTSHTDGTFERLPDAVTDDIGLSVEGASGNELFVGIAMAADVRSYRDRR